MDGGNGKDINTEIRLKRIEDTQTMQGHEIHECMRSHTSTINTLSTMMDTLSDIKATQLAMKVELLERRNYSDRPYQDNELLKNIGQKVERIDSNIVNNIEEKVRSTGEHRTRLDTLAADVAALKGYLKGLSAIIALLTILSLVISIFKLGA